MSVTAADIKFKFTAGLNGSTSNSNPLLSLGHIGSTVEISTGLNNLFDDITASEASAGTTEYRCIDICNTSATAFTAPLVWVTGLGASITIGLAYDADRLGYASDPTHPLVYNLNGGGALPAFSNSYTSEGAALAIGATIPATTGRSRIWIKRIITAGANAATDVGFTLTVKGQTT